YEGQGAEHSSGRMERFLQLCAEYNLQVANCSTPANLFHLLRRQQNRPFRKPLIVFTPKSLLRHPKCVSSLNDFTNAGFKEVIDDVSAKVIDIKKVVFCSGKIYYDLLERQEKENDNSIAIVRLEQIYPLPLAQLKAIVAKYTNAKDWFWVQEEPENMGAWTFMAMNFREVPLKLISRPASASPATGYHVIHDQQQEQILEKVFQKVLVKQ
ncbi:MAG TPA: 2-oxoglutarate dehydrogenase E1 component, partial [Bacteroidia bacterium]|nr:2-oxoglutarate dehydrogenase E1 component [Bacteroidia bacterium]